MSTVTIPEDSDIYHRGHINNYWLFTEIFLFEEFRMLEARGPFRRLVYYSELGQRQ